jgi:hypothetical protein
MKLGDVEYTIKQSLTGKLIVMKRVWVPPYGGIGDHEWSTWRYANFTDIKSVVSLINNIA